MRNPSQTGETHVESHQVTTPRISPRCDKVSRTCDRFPDGASQHGSRGEASLLRFAKSRFLEGPPSQRRWYGLDVALGRFRRVPASVKREIREQEIAVAAVSGDGLAPSRDRARALLKLATSLVGAGRYEEAVSRCDEALSALSGIPSLDQWAYLALMRRSHALMRADRLDEALASIDEAIRMQQLDPSLPDMPVKGLSSRVHLLQILDRHEDAYDAAEALIREFATSDDDKARAAVVEMLTLQGSLAFSRGDHRTALAKFDAALADSAALEPDPASVWRSMVGRAAMLQSLGRGEEALRAFEAFIERYDKSDDNEIQDAVRSALMQRGSLRPR